MNDSAGDSNDIDATERERPKRNNLFSFSLRSLLLLLLVAAAFCGGWVANEARHREKLKREVQIEFFDGSQTMVIRGDHPDVRALLETMDSKANAPSRKQKKAAAR